MAVYLIELKTVFFADKPKILTILVLAHTVHGVHVKDNTIFQQDFE
jgi:hypothetical protein